MFQNRAVGHRVVGAVLGLALLALSGCQDNFFPPENRVRSMDQAVAAQSANGAKDDAMLTAAHFDGVVLNSLGKEKLDLMFNALQPDTPLTVYVNVAEDDVQTGDRRGAVEQYVRDAGLSEKQVVVQVGPNPATFHPVAGDLSRMEKLESPGEDEGRGDEGDTMVNESENTGQQR